MNNRTYERRKAYNARRILAAYSLDTVPSECAQCEVTSYGHRRDYTYYGCTGALQWGTETLCLDCLINAQGAQS